MNFQIHQIVSIQVSYAILIFFSKIVNAAAIIIITIIVVDILRQASLEFTG